MAKHSPEDPNITFISSSQNNLLVCSILTGISLSFDKQYMDKDEAMIPFQKVKVPNPRLFEETMLDDLASNHT